MRYSNEDKLIQLKCNFYQLLNGLLGLTYIALTVFAVYKVVGLFL